MIQMHVVTAAADLEQLAADIRNAAWDKVDEMSDYTARSLAAYLSRQDTLLVVCYDVTPSKKIFMGCASSRFQIKPYQGGAWLYVDEVDVCVDQRQKGAGKAMMNTLIELAKQAGCHEVWLGTEPDNTAANALYQSLRPDDVEPFVGYNFEIDRDQ